MKLMVDTCNRMGWPYNEAEAEKAFKNADLNEDQRIDANELLKAMYGLFILTLETAKIVHEVNKKE
jgi:Ca2+-binding EF-hand superfamily protein